MWKYIFKDMLLFSKIRLLSLLIALSIVLVKKPREGLYFYMDYYILNTVIIKNQYLLLLI